MDSEQNRNDGLLDETAKAAGESDAKTECGSAEVEAESAKETAADAKAESESAKAESGSAEGETDFAMAEGEHKPLLEMREEVKKVFWTPERKKDAREWVVSLAVALVIVFFVRTFLFTVIRVDGDSMKETLHNGERLIVTILDMRINGPQRGDVVICHYPNRRENFVKRVVGLPGDVVEMNGNGTFINGELVDEPFVTYPSMKAYGTYEVPEGCYFVCGDNRANSNDSRYEAVGFLERSMIIGKVRLVMWPITSWRVIP